MPDIFSNRDTKILSVAVGALFAICGYLFFQLNSLDTRQRDSTQTVLIQLAEIQRDILYIRTQLDKQEVK